MVKAGGAHCITLCGIIRNGIVYFQIGVCVILCISALKIREEEENEIDNIFSTEHAKFSNTNLQGPFQKKYKKERQERVLTSRPKTVDNTHKNIYD